MKFLSILLCTSFMWIGGASEAESGIFRRALRNSNSQGSRQRVVVVNGGNQGVQFVRDNRGRVVQVRQNNVQRVRVVQDRYGRQFVVQENNFKQQQNFNNVQGFNRHPLNQQFNHQRVILRNNGGY